MKKNVNVSAEIAQTMNESKVSKGAKVSNCVTSMNKVQTKKEVNSDFMSFVQSEEQISVSKFFKLFNEFKVKHPQRYSNYCSVHKLNLNETYDFIWFKEHCPINESGLCSKWVKVSEKVSANKNETYNRKTEKGVLYTLVPFDMSKASYEQFLPIFISVVSDVKRIEREKQAEIRKAEKEKAEKEKQKKQAEKALKSAKEIFESVLEISEKNSIPFETSLQVYASIKKMQVSTELKEILSKMQKETK